MLRVLVIILSLAVLVAGCNGGTSQGSLIGKPAPDFTFNVTEEQSVSLSDLQGGPVLLNFWATWCDPCAYEMPYLQQVYDDWQEKGLVLLAINIGESYSEVEDFVQSRGLYFPILLDSEGIIALQYGVSNIPASFFIDSQGIVQHVQVGAFQSVADIESILSQLD
jgi:cytochrome c biogenesis protein CcmG/thiol:disulfide interchange protein DsbE